MALDLLELEKEAFPAIMEGDDADAEDDDKTDDEDLSGGEESGSESEI
ncbi:MAG: hypothetical protein Q8P07_03495 [bacterium]|nr:hypothetical protein [bacterium]